MATSKRPETFDVSAQELSEVALFEGLRRDQVEMLAPLFKRVRFTAGQQLFSAGEPATELYYVESGEICLWMHPEDGGRMEVGRITAGGLLGRSAILGRPQYTASAECIAGAQCLMVGGSDLRRVMLADRALGRLLLERIARLVVNRWNGWHDQLMKLFHFDI